MKMFSEKHFVGVVKCVSAICENFIPRKFSVKRYHPSTGISTVCNYFHATTSELRFPSVGIGCCSINITVNSMLVYKKIDTNK